MEFIDYQGYCSTFYIKIVFLFKLNAKFIVQVDSYM
ncbi:hypothetical protein VAE151_520061 [Vibrio aestuarianus]|uniref:Uncharacterized protein n=1 Tax=Vibrio aestuarianus TaxID=28171 RepID=A0ABM9FNF5_9VIBR|nr:hypothetical protein VAE308_1010063 [Vibrio aestuarianus]CAH8185045.1 hypothetical protein VIBAE_A30062 [Vibrio aestuarianus subsp. francensis]CAH8184875.1 hypothetical protein VAE032_240062 [Vibrio aestuarianus]CAH8184990.1 hypothetical protein VAE055_340062 [Vibrio aestuarianus]CAH8185068.1 hypothetical protein VAE128_440062 [Vibrio aestuarianus]